MRETDINLGDLIVHMIEKGPPDGPAMLFLHGWPQCSLAFEAVMQALSDEFRVAAIDLPGVGRSRGLPSGADKRTLARYVEATIRATGLTNVTLVGHDIGGMIVYAYLCAFPDTVERAAILDVVVPGVEPRSSIVRNPQIWHFGFHAVPDLPELLISGHEAAYFDFFYNAIAAHPTAITPDARRLNVEAYASGESLKAGFDWYRAFLQDERDNTASAGSDVSIPVLYVRGDAEPGGNIEAYLDGFRRAGLARIKGATIPNSGHYSPEEQPDSLAAALWSFAKNGSAAQRA